MSDSFFSRKRTVAVLKAAVFLSAFSIAGIAFGATFTARAPENFVRSSGQPVTVTRTFSVLDPTTTFTLVIHNGGLNNEFGRVSSAVVTVNGTDVARPNDFNQQVALIQKPVTLQAINTFTVELRSEPGSGFALEFIGTDNVPPTITASADRPANAAGWYNANVVVSFACFDKTSGVASCPAPITVSTEGGNQTVRGTATDNAGLTSTATISISLDKTPPITTAARSIPPNAGGWNNTNVAVSFSGTDAVSEIASCTPTVTFTNEGRNQSASGNCTDVAGNVSTTVTVSGINIDKTPPTLTFGNASPAPNAAGWNNTNVSFSFVAADSLSGVGSTSVASPLVLTTEGTTVTGSVTVTDVAGNSATFVSPGAVKIDKTPPVVTFGSGAPAPNAAGWNNTNVSFTFTTTDAISGLASTSTASPIVLTSEGSSVTGSVTVADVAGNTATYNSPAARIDKTPPTAQALASPQANAAGWNNTNVVVSITGADAGSGIASCSASTTLSTEGKNQSASGTCVDNAGNVSQTAGITGINIDKTSPTLTFGTPAPVPNAAGWNNTDVAIAFTTADALSGVGSTSAASPLTLTTQGSTVNGAVTVTDVAGNSSTFTSPSVKIDKTPPTITFAMPVPAPNAAGWNNSNVTLAFTAADALSGVVSTSDSSPLSFTTEGSALSRSVTVTDIAGNTATYASPALKIDKTPPTSQAAVAPAPNAAGWNNTNVTVSFTGTDALSGIASCSSAVALNNEGANQSASGTCVDNAGNISASSTATGINIDKTPPTLTFAAAAPQANAAGWNNTNVTFAFTAADVLSGVASTSVPSPLVLSTEGAAVSGSVTITDVAGNSASFTSAAVKIDKTPPVTTATRSIPPNAAGWNNTNVTVSFTGTDAVSGIASCAPAVTLSNEAANQSASGTCTDIAGNISPPSTVSGISIDKTPPTLTYGAANPLPNAAGWNNTNVAYAFTTADNLSGVFSTSIPSPLSLTTEGSSITGSVTVTDVAGNTAAFTSPATKIDKTPPTLTFAAASPAPNAAGWNNTNVTFAFTTADALSGVASTSVPAPLVLGTEGASVTGRVTVTDVAGNSATFNSPAMKIDKTPPAVQAAASPQPNAAGWNNTNVTVSFTGTDGLSGIASCSPNASLTTEAPDQSATGTCTDVAGNVSAAATVTGIKIDKTPPTLAFGAANPTPNAAGWNNTNVSFMFTTADNLSGVAAVSPPSPLVLSTEGTAVSGSITVTDVAGNSGTFTSPTVKIDKTPPTLAFGPAMPAPNAAGWNNTDVCFTYTATDSLSGMPITIALFQPLCVTTEGSSVTGSTSVTDVAGNTASFTTPPLKIDKTAPTARAAASPAPNANGWNNTNVTVAFTGTDALSGIATCSSDVVLSTEGKNQSGSGTCTDVAGNVSQTATLSGINIDKTPPTFATAIVPAPNANGWNKSDVTVTFSATDALSGIASVTPPVTVTTEGANQSIPGTAVDLAGNTATGAAKVSLDKTPPVITSSQSPPANAKGWNNTNVTVSFTATDALSGVDTVTSPVTLSTEGANQSTTGTAVDLAGNQVTATLIAKIDKTPPVITITSPSTGANVFASPVNMTGTATDALSGIDTVTCNATPATVTGTNFSCSVPLVSGANSINDIATDLAGNSATATGSVNFSPFPKITITSPPNLSWFNISPTTVTGTVDDPAATVMVNAVQAAVVNGSFSVAVPLQEGPNTITAVATSSASAAGTATIEVTLDTTPPHVMITSPPDKFVTTDSSISVAGNINDIVVGTVNAEQASVTVNGVTGQVANRTFLATSVPLTIGDNTIQATGRDRVGNFATTQITVTRQPPTTQPQIKLVSGNNQTGMIGSIVSAPLVVALTDSTGQPAANKQVIFKVIQNNGMVSASGSAAASSVVATTNAQGQAQAQWTLGMRAGAGGNTLEAYSVGFSGSAIFTATGNQGLAGNIVVDTGNQQTGAIGQPLPKPFIAVVVDGGNNRLGGVPVTFSVLQGGGSFNGQPSYTVTSDSDGRIAATLTLGMQEGNGNNLVEATFLSNQGLPAAFTASGRAAGDASKTTISGVVLDNSNLPIPGATVRAVLTNVVNANATSVQTAPSAQTNAQGQFTITPAPVGAVKLIVDGSTAQLQGTYPSLEYDMVTVSGQNNTVGNSIYLLPLNAANQLCVTATTGGGTLTIPEAPGFSLTFSPGQVTFPGGSKAGCISVTAVHPDKVPMVPGFGQQPRFIVTIQPPGAIFNPPAAITLPNVDGLPPRAVTEMYSYDHDISSFVAIGTGVVSDDGQVIRSSPGVGVLKSGWHCGGNPNQSGSAATCPICMFCQGTQCTPQGNGTPCGNGGTCQFAGVGQAPICNCPMGQVLVNGTCQPLAGNCPPGQLLSNGQCYPTGNCPPGQALINGTCQYPTGNCPAGQVLIAGQCYTTGNCTNGQVLINGICQYPTGNCPQGQVLVNGVCQPLAGNCPPGQLLSNGQCYPTGGCPTGQAFINGRCQYPTGNCPQGQVLVNGVCQNPPPTCPNGQVSVNGQCPTPVITQVLPNQAQQGQMSLPVTIFGQNTSFAQGSSQVDLGPDVFVNSVAVQCPTSLTADLTISPTAALTSRTVTVTTGSEVATLINGFTIIPQQCPAPLTTDGLSNFKLTTSNSCPVIVQNKQLWYLNGEPTPSGLASQNIDGTNRLDGATSILLSAQGTTAAQGPFFWRITSGGDHAVFEPGDVTEISTNVPSVVMNSRGPSALHGVTVQLTLQGPGAPSVPDYTLDVRTPKYLKLISTANQKATTECDPNVNAGDRFLTKVTYQILDQFDELVLSAGLNEVFGPVTLFTQNFSSINWTGQITGPSTSSDGLLNDRFCVQGPLSTLQPMPRNPEGDNADSFRVTQSDQTWFAGSMTAGRGVRVQTGTVVFFIDHAELRNRTSPP